MSTETKCPKCQRVWANNSEQAACVRVYDLCLVCAIDLERSEGFEWSLEKVMAEHVVAGLGKIGPVPAQLVKKMTTQELINTLKQGKPMTDRLMREIVRELEEKTEQLHTMSTALRARWRERQPGNGALYELSKDYNALFDLLLEGKEPVGFVDNNYDAAPKVARDVCVFRRRGEHMTIAVSRGNIYFSVDSCLKDELGMSEREAFCRMCNDTNVEWIAPSSADAELAKLKSQLLNVYTEEQATERVRRAVEGHTAYLQSELAALKDAASRSLDDAYNSFGDREEAHERLTGVAKLVVKSWNTVELGALKDAIEDMAALVGEGF